MADRDGCIIICAPPPAQKLTAVFVVNQVNDLAEIGRDIESFTKAGRHVPTAVWEKYDRVNKRHKKHEEMATVAADMRETQRRRAVRARPEREAAEGGGPGDDRCHSESETLRRSHSSQLKVKRRSGRRRAGVVAGLPFQCRGEGCTFGSSRGDGDVHRGVRPAGTRTTTMRSQSSPWGSHEREKLNELCECSLSYCCCYSPSEDYGVPT